MLQKDNAVVDWVAIVLSLQERQTPVSIAVLMSDLS